jgi:hypothetical protein
VEDLKPIDTLQELLVGFELELNEKKILNFCFILISIIFLSKKFLKRWERIVIRLIATFISWKRILHFVIVVVFLISHLQTLNLMRGGFCVHVNFCNV